MKCLNCSNPIEKKFCNICGQKTSTHRFSIKHILDVGILNGIFTINKGFFFTLKELFTRPGHSIREYINGKRVKYFNAFSLLILLIAIVYLADEYSDLRLADIMNEGSKDFANSMEEFTKNYPRLIYIINIPIMAFSSYIFFKKSKVNFAENIILNTYISSGLIVLTFPFTLLTIFYKDKSVLGLLFQLTPLITIGYSLLVYYQFFSDYKYKKRNLIFRSIFAIILFMLLQGITFASIVGIKNIL